MMGVRLEPENNQSIAAAQTAGLSRWPEIEAATLRGVLLVDRAVRARGSGWRLDGHSSAHSMPTPRQVVFGEQHRMTFDYRRGDLPNRFIDVALVTSNGSAPVTFVITHDQKRLVELPVDRGFQVDAIERLLAGVIDAIDCDTA